MVGYVAIFVQRGRADYFVSLVGQPLYPSHATSYALVCASIFEQIHQQAYLEEIEQPAILYAPGYSARGKCAESNFKLM